MTATATAMARLTLMRLKAWEMLKPQIACLSESDCEQHRGILEPCA